MKTLEQKRKEGVLRNAEWNSLSLEEQIQELQNRPGNSEKQLKKLYNAKIVMDIYSSNKDNNRVGDTLYFNKVKPDNLKFLEDVYGSKVSVVKGVVRLSDPFVAKYC